MPSPTVPLIILGAGGHAHVVAELLLSEGYTRLGATDVEPPIQGEIASDLIYLGDDHAVYTHSTDSVLLVNGVGSVGPTHTRHALYQRFINAGYRFVSACHPSAVVSPSAQLGAGHQILATAVIATGAQLGNNVLINTRAVIEHDCTVGDHCHIASGAVVCGDCHIGTGVHIGAGATINQGIRIGTGAVIASGAAVIADVAPFTLLAGVPAQLKRTLTD